MLHLITTVVLAIIIIVCLCGMLFSIFMLDRNHRVAKYRQSILDLVGEATKEDIIQNRDWQWRYDMYESVKYQDMIKFFWKNLGSFYPDNNFTNPNATERES
jgi:hypothetical protein